MPTYFYGEGFISPPADGKVGGLRIKKISNYAYDGAVPEVKTYDYVCELPATYGQLNVQKFTYYQQTFNYYWAPIDGCLNNNTKTATSWKYVGLGIPMGRYIGGPQAPVYYNKVTEYIGDGQKNAGKTVYYYQEFESQYFDDPVEPRYCAPWEKDVGSYVPPLIKKEEYKNNNGLYQLVRKTETEYPGMTHSFYTGINISSDLLFHNMDGEDTKAFECYNEYLQEYYFSTLHYSDPKAFSQFNTPTKTTVYDYVDGNNFLQTTTEYTYNQYAQPVASSTTTSKGEFLKTKLTYPVDYPAQAPYNSMIERNIISPVIEQSTYKDAIDPQNLLQSMKTNYNYWDHTTQTWSSTVTNQILPQNVETKKGTNDTETRIQYYSYDNKGNPIYFAKENDVRQFLIWSYNNLYPIAQVVNVPEEQKNIVSYTSFEDNNDGDGNWFITGLYSKQYDNTVPTGKKCLAFSTSTSRETYIRQGLNAGTNYILSYWYKNGSSVFVIANSTILSTQSKNGWTYVKAKITGSASVSITGRGYIDELRLYPESAQMTTFAYEPGVGITAQCDVNDKITYYTYDASGRLTLIKDDNGNILKKIDYHFRSPSDPAGPNLLPQWEKTGVTRCKACALNPAYWTNETQLQERDNNVNSETYGTIRWRDTGVIGGPGACYILGDWQLTGNLRCRTVSGQITGEQEREWKDMNPCSFTFGNTNWEIFGTNTTACPPPALFQSLDVSGLYYSQNCPSSQNAKAFYVSMPQGAYTSSINIQDATNKAKAEAQRLANQNNQCFNVYVKVRLELKSDPSADQQFSDIHFYFYADAAGTIPLTLPGLVTVNYRIHEWWTDHGGPPVNDAYADYSHNVFNHADEIVSELESKFCPDNISCYHQEVILLPGRYVIIP